MGENQSLFRGVGPDEPIIENEHGGLQAKIPYRFELIDSHAIFSLAAVLAHGAEKYARDNWRKIDSESHLNHAITHIYAHLGGDKQDDHLEHAFCRLMMAVAVAKGEQNCG